MRNKNIEVPTLKCFQKILLFALLLNILLACSEKVEKIKDTGLKIGWAIEDITPQKSVLLRGQYYERKSEYIQSPLKATAMAIESISGEEKEQAIMVSLDLIGVDKLIQDSVRQLVKGKIPGFEVQKLIFNATHTHSAPNFQDSLYRDFIFPKLCNLVKEAWNNRKPAATSRQIDYTVVGHNRRVIFADGSAEMYGSTERNDFVGIEGPTDPAVDMIFCWNLDKELTGIIMNVSCPSQVNEAQYFISSDYWGEFRKQLSEKFGDDVFVLPQCSAAGDISPRDLTCKYKAGEPNMWNVEGAKEIGKRLINAVENVFPGAKKEIRTNIVFKHSIKQIKLPPRKISVEEFKKAKEIVQTIHIKEPADPDSPDTAWNRFLKEVKENEKTKEYGPWDNKTSDYGWLKPCESIIRHYKEQDTLSELDVELHVIRLGDAVFATNPFELYVDYGSVITARNKASQTFIVQLCGDYCGYLPTPKAVEGGGYSAMITKVGPEGGRVLVEQTVKTINALFE